MNKETQIYIGLFGLIILVIWGILFLLFGTSHSWFGNYTNDLILGIIAGLYLVFSFVIQFLPTEEKQTISLKINKKK